MKNEYFFLNQPYGDLSVLYLSKVYKYQVDFVFQEKLLVAPSKFS